MRHFRLPPRCSCLRSTEKIRGVAWKPVNNVSGQHTGPILNSHALYPTASPSRMVPMLSPNVSKQLRTYAAQDPRTENTSHHNVLLQKLVARLLLSPEPSLISPLLNLPTECLTRIWCRLPTAWPSTPKNTGCRRHVQNCQVPRHEFLFIPQCANLTQVQILSSEPYFNLCISLKLTANRYTTPKQSDSCGNFMTSLPIKSNSKQQSSNKSLLSGQLSHRSVLHTLVQLIIN
jgi:hypothetical protein